MGQSNLVINVDVGETRVALLEEGALAELYIERTRERSPVGNVYLGKVTRVLPGMQAAFIDIGLERAAFLHVEDVVNPHIDDDEGEDESDGGDEDAKPAGRSKRLTRETPIGDVLKEGQSLLVQVAKAPIGTKGARVTSHISLPGRYAVLTPTVDHVGVSKRIGRDRERKRLKEIIEALKPAGMGVIIRTVASGLTKKSLKQDIAYLLRTWEEIQNKVKATRKAPALIYADLDLIARSMRDLLSDEVTKIVIDDEDECERLMRFLGAFAPTKAELVRLYRGTEPLFDEYGIEDEIARSLARKVPLPSGGYLVIDQAEALTAIDVNTGRFTGKGKSVNETIVQTNLEAAREISFQLRFRNIGGLIVLDFIDMERSTDRDRVFQKLLEHLKKDKAKTTAVRISELGLVEMTRKRTQESLGRLLNAPCFYCDGTGMLFSKTTVAHEILRQIKREKDALPGYGIVVNAHPAICDALERDEKESVKEVAARVRRRIRCVPHNDYHLEQYDLNGE